MDHQAERRQRSALIQVSDEEFAGNYFWIPKMGCCDIFGIIALVITIALSLISLATPYWAVSERPPDYVVDYFHQGLFASCKPQTCEWLFLDKVVQEKTPAWFKATQVLMSAGLALGLLSLLIATLSLCCSCRKCNPSHPICILLILGGLTMGSAVVVFGIQAKEEWQVQLQWSMTSSGRFGWSYWVGVAAAGLSLFTGSIYGCMGHRRLD